MDIKLHYITVRELVDGYQDMGEDGVVGYGGKLNIRPPYQREFVYNDKQREAVIHTIFKGYPLNTMYWAVTPSGFEIIDGQQRTVSICQYVDGIFAYQGRYFHNLQKDEQNAFLDYQLTIYHCEGTDSEKLAWFRTINIAGVKLTDQELRNAVYAGPWTADAKRYFSRSNCPAWQIGEPYLVGSPIRQDYLETAIAWISDGDIEGYMAKHQHDSTANPLWLYFQAVIAWVKATFPTYRREMKGVPWGFLYNKYKDEKLDPVALEEEVARLMADDDVTRKKGIYEYVLTRDERHLNIRTFTPTQKRTIYERQKGLCAICQQHFSFEDMEADHIVPWSQGGKTAIDNGQLLCRDCNRKKANR